MYVNYREKVCSSGQRVKVNRIGLLSWLFSVCTHQWLWRRLCNWNQLWQYATGDNTLPWWKWFLSLSWPVMKIMHLYCTISMSLLHFTTLCRRPWAVCFELSTILPPIFGIFRNKARPKQQELDVSYSLQEVCGWYPLLTSTEKM